MSRHMKRSNVPKSWPINRKGTSFVVRSSSMNKGIPTLIAMRDILRLAQNRKEVKKAIHSNHLLINNKPIKEERQAIVLFDVLSIVPMKKHYRLELSENGKFALNEIKESSKKIAKVVNKKTLKGKKTQLNLSDGRNYLSDLKCKTNDSVIIEFTSNKITKCLELKEKSHALIVAGKHTGKTGTIEEIIKDNKMVKVKLGEFKVNVLIKQLVVIE